MGIWGYFVGGNFVEILRKILRNDCLNCFWWGVEEIWGICVLRWRNEWGRKLDIGVYVEWIWFSGLWKFWVVLIIWIVERLWEEILWFERKVW